MTSSTSRALSDPSYPFRMYSVLIEHPTEGLILFETGPGPGVTGTEEDYESTSSPTLSRALLI
jgi:hypothetical protein